MTEIGVFFVNREEYAREMPERDPDDISCWAKGNPLSFLVRHLVHLYMCRQKWIHIEIAFFDADLAARGKCTGYSMVQGGVRKQERTFNRNQYHYVLLDLGDPERVQRIRRFCEKALSRRAKFDYGGVYRSILWPRDPRKNHFWCVTFVVRALQEGNVLQWYRGAALDVDDVVAMLQHHPMAVNGMTPYQIKEIKEKGNLLQIV